MDWTGLKGKQVYIKTKTGRIYTAFIKDVITENFNYILYIIDKFGKSAMIRNDEIVEWREL